MQNPYLTAVFSTLVGNSHLTATSSSLVRNFRLSAVFLTLVRNSHLIQHFMPHRPHRHLIYNVAACPILSKKMPTLSSTWHLVRCCFKRCPPYRQHRSLVRNPYLTAIFPTLVGNSHLSTVFPTLVRNSHLTATFSILVRNFVLRSNIPTLAKNYQLTAVFPSLVGNSHLRTDFSILVRNFQLSTDFCTLTGIYASTLMPECYLQHSSLPVVMPKFTHLINKMSTHLISCLNSAILFTRQRLVRCYGILCPSCRNIAIFSGHRKAPGRSAPPGAAQYFHFLLL